MLDEIIFSLNREESRDFKVFLQINNNRLAKKRIELFNLIKNNYEQKVIVSHLYKTNKTPNAYNELRNSLMKQLEKFILLKNSNQNSWFKIVKLISISDFLFSKNLSKEGWKYLYKAQKSCKENNFHDLASILYIRQFKYAYTLKKESLSQITEQYQNEFNLLVQTNNARIAAEQIRKDLQNSLSDAIQTNTNKIINTIFEKFNITIDSKHSPQILFDLVIILYRNALSNKQLNKGFEKFIAEKYVELNQSGFFKQNTNALLMYYYTWCIVLIYTKNFKKLDILLIEYRQTVNNFDINYLHQSSFYVNVAFSNLIYNNQNKQAINLIEDLLEKIKKEDYYTDLLYLNLSTAYFQENDTDNAITAINKTQKTDKRFKKTLGIRTLLTKDLAECIIHYEAKNYLYVENRLNTIRRKFKNILNIEEYQYELKFIKLFVQLNNNPSVINIKSFVAEASLFTANKEINMVESEPINFRAWIIAKLEKRDYYKVYLEMVYSKPTPNPSKEGKVKNYLPD